MEPGEPIEETMIREVREGAGISIKEFDFLSVYMGKRMMYKYPDGNEVVFVMFFLK
ncbi:NUDIX domain-containing protein [Solibacillus sp. MA9]|uniref:NUDIX domain-containing protein n=1 Tax=Solibacillus palustris TaxID=2908203 RepID=A0ABS9U8E1_9BACL|nr:NUDIX domain-containing protein [Solibacillus sp. MA9]MCH7320596.1 NUDIX domain-containing protein [Solibacillus sp. MA9]